MEQLNEIRARFFAMVLPWLTDGDREFLLGFRKGEPDWEYLDIDHVRGLPGVRWKQHNLDRMTPQARRASCKQPA